MRKVIIAAVILITAAALIFLVVLNLNGLIRRNKDYLLGQAEQALGRKLSVGEVSVTLWGGLGARFKDFALTDDPAFSTSPFIRASDLQINVKVLPLIRKEVSIKRLILHDPHIAIIRDAQGNFNFSSIGKKKEKKEEEKKKPPSPSERTPMPLLFSLVDITNGAVSYVDKKEHANLSIDQLNLKVKDLDFKEPFSIELSAAVPAGKQNLKLNAQVGPLGSGAPFSEVPIDGKINIDPLDLGKLEAEVPQIRSYLPKNLDLSGQFQVKDLNLKGTLKKLAVNGTVEGTNGQIKFGETFYKPAGVALTLSADSLLAEKALSLKQAKLRLQTLELTTKGEAKWDGTQAVNLTVDTNRFGLAGWEKIIPALKNNQPSGNVEAHATVRGGIGKGAAPQINGTLSLAGVGAQLAQLPKPIKDLNAKVTFTGEQAQIPDASLRIGDSPMRLSARVEKFSPLTLTYRLAATELHASDFQRAEAKGGSDDVLKSLSNEGSLRMQNGSLFYQGKLSSAQGTLHKISYNDLATAISLENKVAAFKNLNVKALNGSLQADGQYDMSGATPRFNVSSKTSGLDLRELSRALQASGGKQFQGRLNSNLKVSGRGKSWEEMKPTLTGQGDAEVLQGALLDFNIAQAVLSGVTGMPGLTDLIKPEIKNKYPEIFTAKNTEFKQLKTQFTLGEGKANIKDLIMNAADFGVHGNGWVDFNQRIDMQALLTLSSRLSADVSHSVREAKYLFNDKGLLEIPFSLKGTLPGVRPKPDMSHLGKQLQRGFFQKGIEELQKRVGPKEPQTKEGEKPSEQKKQGRPPTEELIRKGLQGLFGK